MKNKVYIIFALALIALAGCKESFFDINDNPNNAEEESVKPSLLLPTVLNATAKKMAVDYDFLAHWMGYWSRGADYGQSLPLENYNLTTTYEQNNWVNGNTSVVNPAISWYDILNDADKMEKRALASNQPFYIAAAKVVKSIGFMYLVDMYNNVPYSQALDVVNYIAPEYDKGQDIYKNLLVELDEAKSIFKEDIEMTEELTASDIMFHGDLDMWIKLANTQKLKLLIHEADFLGSTPTAEINKLTEGFLMSGETASVNPGYANNQYQQNPFYAAFYRDHNGSISNDFDRANVFLLDSIYRRNNDPRYKFVFRAATNPRTQTDADLYRGSVFGIRSQAGFTSARQSIVAGPGIVDSPTQDLWLFTSVESLFLQAEAYQRGWLSGVTAEAAYENAIKESFLWLGVDEAGSDANAQTYIDSNVEVVAWNSANPLKSIITQKYIALAGINNFEAWVDYRRLGYPSNVPLSVNSTRNGRNIPLRLLYPQNEYSFNAKNVNAQGTIDAQTSKVFWDVN